MNNRGSFWEKIQRFMYGRYGQMDSLNKFLMAAWLILYLFGAFFRRLPGVGLTVSMLSTVMFVLVVLRMMSKNVYKRSAENLKYMEIKNRLFGKAKGKKSYTSGEKSYKTGARTAKVRPVRDPAYKYFKCIKCKKTVRVPKNHGKVELTCKNCGHTFVRYTGKRQAK